MTGRADMVGRSFCRPGRTHGAGDPVRVLLDFENAVGRASPRTGRSIGPLLHSSLKERPTLLNPVTFPPGERNRPIANDYGVSISTVHLIRHGRIWRHVA